MPPSARAQAQRTAPKPGSIPRDQYLVNLGTYILTPGPEVHQVALRDSTSTVRLPWFEVWKPDVAPPPTPSWSQPRER